MDEAWKLGQGNYLKLHGYRKKIDIMSEYLSRVLQITDRLGLRPMIWSDMYFRGASKTGDYYDESSAISLRLAKSASKPLGSLAFLLDARFRDGVWHGLRFQAAYGGEAQL